MTLKQSEHSKKSEQSERSKQSQQPRPPKQQSTVQNTETSELPTPELQVSEVQVQQIQSVQTSTPSTPFKNLSGDTGKRRIGRAACWIERDGLVMMVALNHGWTLAGGGVEEGETPAEAAVREAWEEAGARVKIIGDPIDTLGLTGTLSQCFPARLISLEPSPEGRPVIWVNPRSLPWANDVQIRQMLRAKDDLPEYLALPDLVTKALAKVKARGYSFSCSLETGRFLKTLAAGKQNGRIAEMGTGMGMGSAWLLSGLNASGRLWTVERDPVYADIAREILADDPRAEVLADDWNKVLEHGPFDLIFVDCDDVKRSPESMQQVIDALSPSGTLIIDDFSPLAHIPEAFLAGDAVRDWLFSHPQLICSELQVHRRECVIMGVKVG